MVTIMKTTLLLALCLMAPMVTLWGCSPEVSGLDSSITQVADVIGQDIPKKDTPIKDDGEAVVMDRNTLVVGQVTEVFGNEVTIQVGIMNENTNGQADGGGNTGGERPSTEEGGGQNAGGERPSMEEGGGQNAGGERPSMPEGGGQNTGGEKIGRAHV